jgi:L-threonylcarbamoyladenylate synthase
MRTRRVTVNPAEPDAAVVADAAAVLRRGGVVAFPTETFYGLGALALDRAAVRRIFELKGRPRSRPLLVLVDSVEMAERFATIPRSARPLIARYWPGPLTLVVPARAVVPEELTASTGTVGIRVSAHPVARALVAAFGDPLTAPSANVTGEEPPTSAGAVLSSFDRAIELILDGGETPGGLPSTVLDVTVDPPRIIRHGAVTL